MPGRAPSSKSVRTGGGARGADGATVIGIDRSARSRRASAGRGRGWDHASSCPRRHRHCHCRQSFRCHRGIRHRASLLEERLLRHIAGSTPRPRAPWMSASRGSPTSRRDEFERVTSEQRGTGKPINCSERDATQAADHSSADLSRPGRRDAQAFARVPPACAANGAAPEQRGEVARFSAYKAVSGTFATRSDKTGRRGKFNPSRCNSRLAKVRRVCQALRAKAERLAPQELSRVRSSDVCIQGHR